MISITELWTGRQSRSHKIRYNKDRDLTKVSPVVVWNSTRKCNLKCIHCYTNSLNKDYPSDLTTEQAKQLIDNLADFQIPCLLFSGGEPLLRNDFRELINYSKSRDLPAALSTNGTLIGADTAKFLKEMNIRYAGISIDGLRETNDKFRGTQGAFDQAIKAFHNLREFDVKSGLRLTLTKDNIDSLGDIFKLVEDNEIERVCFYHLVPAGRGSKIKDLIPQPLVIRKALDSIIDWSESLVKRNINTEVLTVDNHADNIYLYLRKKKTSEEEAKRIFDLISNNGGAKMSSGVGIADIDPEGNVHPDQFWSSLDLGNVKERPFSEIWTDQNNIVLNKLRERTKHIEGRCKTCRWLEVCGGGLRSRALGYYGNAWAEDPGCYLTNEEIR